MPRPSALACVVIAGAVCWFVIGALTVLVVQVMGGVQ